MSVPLRSAFVFIFGASCLALYWASCPPPSAPPRVMTRDRFEKLIDSLANRNPKPIFVNVYTSYCALYNPLFADDYDFEKDHLVRKAMWELSQYDNEEVWRWLVEHLHDDRYALADAFNDGAYISSIGSLCRRAVTNTLWCPYIDHLPPSLCVSRPILRPFGSRDEEDAWFRDHSDTPLYQQQISLCEAAIKKIPKLARARGIDSERKEFAADIRKEIDELRRTRQPMLCHFRMYFGETDQYNAALAKQIKHDYLEAQAKAEAKPAQAAAE